MTDPMERFQRRTVDEPTELHQNGHSSNPLQNMVSVADYEDEIRTANVKVELADGRVMPLTLTYDPNQVNDATDNRIFDYADAGDDLAAARVFCEIVQDWNMAGPLTALVPQYDEDGGVSWDDHGNPLVSRQVIVDRGSKVPLDPEVIQYLRSGLVVAIWKSLREDAIGLPTNRRERRQQLRQSRQRSRQR